MTGVTDASFRTIDKIMSAAGLIKINELVLPGTLKMTTLPKSKQQLCTHWGQKLTTKTKRDDNTVKRYIELFLYGRRHGIDYDGGATATSPHPNWPVLVDLRNFRYHLFCLACKYFAFLYSRQTSTPLKTIVYSN